MKINVSLRQEVYRDDAINLVKWLRDKEVTKYLNEDKYASENIENLLNTINIPILTHLFNNNGKFQIINNNKEAIGFVRLVPKGNNAEIVIAIGEKELWGKGYGKAAIIESLKQAFFDWRVDEVIAKIRTKNIRSRRAFESIGFKENKILQNEIIYTMSIYEFLKLAA
ncbi:GNAT family N-acetyltransferase [Clostridium septicum]|uniref:N-acetyltransferase n=1 Tax=Clostridium septicum TaxID=1504 RepID=A0A9N7PKW4_CLOSE|nr:GNAT family N-acetyltransferase [Clostridium septicum]AYE33227.1 N-acetyltransferase [Clostridium septicum]QAS61399.1 N-acetyltransferase [Clostridium septicum]UEC22170.1 GNAT family N-acetyltransferase [Clostridium septicum]USR99799.1 GNAT family N-acetyltransferase [Clostridium septicum]